LFVFSPKDNKRAVLVSSDERTFGKGRIQNVQALEDGSGVAVKDEEFKKTIEK
jgi:C-terminal processing protease CtpA/Prc